MKLTKLFNEFFDSGKAGGILLLFATIASLAIANSSWHSGFIKFWNSDLGGHSVVHWINDGLMTVFFLLIGLELEREIYSGELSDLKKASLPFFAATGGMLVPFVLFTLFNIGTEAQSGAGIPMATDIAFAIGILSLLGTRVPSSLKIFLTAFAVIDDLGAIILIAIFYTSSLSLINLLIALAIFAFLIILNRLKVHNLLPYLAGGLAMWYFMVHSGVHPTIAGVLLAFAVPYGDGRESSPSYILQHVLHKPVAFFIMPLFALANTSIHFGDNLLQNLGQSYSIGIMAGLVLGKPLGICIFSFAAIWLGISGLPSGLKLKSIAGAGILGGIGFTMSIFISLLAFDNPDIVNGAKISILAASAFAGLAGFIWLRLSLRS